MRAMYSLLLLSGFGQMCPASWGFSELPSSSLRKKEKENKMLLRSESGFQKIIREHF